MRDPDSAAHALGKLFKFVGEDNVLWGTDSIWYGSPQDQIQAFRTFQIADELAAARLSEDHAGAAREGLRPQCACASTRSPTTCCGSTCRATRSRGIARLSRARRSDVPDPRAEDAARVPQSAGVERSSRLIKAPVLRASRELERAAAVVSDRRPLFDADGCPVNFTWRTLFRCPTDCSVVIAIADGRRLRRG